MLPPLVANGLGPLDMPRELLLLLEPKTDPPPPLAAGLPLLTVTGVPNRLSRALRAAYLSPAKVPVLAVVAGVETGAETIGPKLPPVELLITGAA